MKKIRLGIMALSAAFLISCTQNSTSSEDASEMDVSSNDSSSLENADSSSVSSSSIDDGSLSFEEAYNEIAKAQKSELNNAQSVIYHNESSSATIKNKINQTYTNYEDGSTTSEGTYTYSVEGKEDQVDTFKTISTSTVDKYENGDDFDSYRMFVEVTDFDKDLGASDNYQDSASKKFIINSEEDVGNLSAGEYILAKDFEANAAANLTSKLANFLAGDIMGNDYVIQTGLNKVKPTQKETGEWEYLIQFQYSSKDDGITTTYLTKAQYTLSQDKSQLLSFDTLNKTTYAREGEESAYSLYEESGEIIYGDKAKKMGNDVLNVDNYFLADVLSIRLEAVAGFKTITVGDDLTIPTNCSTIYGYADNRKPLKAMNTALAPSKSSNEEAVTIEDGNFVIKGVGTTNLTFSYYRKRPSTGVYYSSSFTVKNVTIISAKVETVSFNAKGDINLHYGLEVGKAYSWGYTVSPKEAPQAITASVDNPEMADVIVNSDSTITIKPKKEGEFSITLISVGTPEIFATKGFYALSNTTDYKAFLTGHKFFYKNSFGTAQTLTFLENGTCLRHIEQTDNGKISSSDDTFKWSLEGTVITFSGPDGDFKVFESGRIVKFLNKEGQPLGISISADDFSENAFIPLSE